MHPVTVAPSGSRHAIAAVNDAHRHVQHDGTFGQSLRSFGFDGDSCDGCIAAINEYLLNDPNRYFPSANHLQRLTSTLTQQINSAVKGIFTAAEASQVRPSSRDPVRCIERIPDLYGITSCEPFFHICKRVYGAGTVEELDNKIGRLFVTIQNLLRSLLATAIDDWVLNNGHSPLPDLGTKTDISLVYENELRQREYLCDHVSPRKSTNRTCSAS